MVLNRGGTPPLGEKYSGLDLGLDFDSFSSRSRTLGLEIFPVSISVFVSKKFYGLGLESCSLDYYTVIYRY